MADKGQILMLVSGIAKFLKERLYIILKLLIAGELIPNNNFEITPVKLSFLWKKKTNGLVERLFAKYNLFFKFLDKTTNLLSFGVVQLTHVKLEKWIQKLGIGTVTKVSVVSL